jgi:hypothetical protein
LHFDGNLFYFLTFGLAVSCHLQIVDFEEIMLLCIIQ